MFTTVQLKPDELLPGRLFASPEASSFDVTVLQYMVDTLAGMLSHSAPSVYQPRPYITCLEEHGGRMHRICLSQPERLLAAGELVVVGFCGKKRPGVDRGPLDAVDDQLIQEMPQHKHMLSYSTIQLECHNTVNLVLFDHLQGLSHWATSPQHVVAVRLSPDYYTVIRLHNAILPGGLLAGSRLRLLRTKYYDFQTSTPWHAVREFTVCA
jgi:hypothetical protein